MWYSDVRITADMSWATSPLTSPPSVSGRMLGTYCPFYRMVLNTVKHYLVLMSCKFTGGAKLILNLGISWSWVVKFIFWPLYPWEGTPVHSEYKAFGPQSWSGRGREEYNLLPLPVYKPWTIQPSHYTKYTTTPILSKREYKYRVMSVNL